MPNLPISLLPDISGSTLGYLGPDAEFAVAQGGVTYKVKNNNLSPFHTVYGLYSQTGDSSVVSGTTVESSIIGPGIGVLTVPANGFQVGDSFRVDIGGVMNAQNGETIIIRVDADSSVLLDSGAQNLGSSVIDDIWSLSVNFTVRQIGTAGVASMSSVARFSYAKTNNGTVQGFGFQSVNNTTFNTTITNALTITVQWGSADIDNSIYSDVFVLNKIY